MLQIRVAIQLASLRQPFSQALLTAARLGAEAVEIDLRHGLKPEELSHTGVRQVRKMLEDLNLRVSAASFRTNRGYHVLADLDARIDATKRALKTAYDLGARALVNHIGRLPDPASPEWGVLTSALADIGREGLRVGAQLAAETATESGADLARLLGAIPSGALGIDLNPARSLMNGFSPQEIVSAVGPYILHVHATDGTRDVAAGRGLEVQLGRGSAEFPELLGMLEEHQYRGFITIERTDSPDPLSDIAAAVKFLKAL